ncbi:MAG: hypothetical protein COB76_05555, partial [Alphaproteobacteria bacterium]
GIAIAKAHADRGLPQMNRAQRKAALQFSMVVSDLNQASDTARKDVTVWGDRQVRKLQSSAKKYNARQRTSGVHIAC